MKPEVKSKWLAALRSGKYQKNQGCLRDAHTNCFCVMGVLCDIYAQENKERWIDGSGEAWIRDDKGILSHALMPPFRVVKWAQDEPTSHLPSIEYKGRLFALGELNDVYDITFSEMADLIEKQY